MIRAWALAVVFGIFVLMTITGCGRLPPLAEQEQHIRSNELPLHQLTPRAFVGVWGQPTYQRLEFTPFFVMKDGSMVPRSRMAVGEAPRGWEGGVEAGEGLFLAYPDHGWLVVFYEEKLVYKEALTEAELHAVGRSWQHESRFKSRLESPPTP